MRGHTKHGVGTFRWVLVETEFCDLRHAGRQRGVLPALAGEGLALVLFERRADHGDACGLRERLRPARLDGEPDDKAKAVDVRLGRDLLVKEDLGRTPHVRLPDVVPRGRVDDRRPKVADDRAVVAHEDVFWPDVQVDVADVVDVRQAFCWKSIHP